MTNLSKTKIINLEGRQIVINTLNDNYGKLSTKEKNEFEKSLGRSILTRFKKDEKQLVRKALLIRSLNAVAFDNYYEILSEAIDSFILGNYKASIACCGITTELISFELSLLSKSPIVSKDNIERMSHHSRLILLLEKRKINTKIYQKLNEVKKIRNLYIHNSSRKIKNSKSDEENAKICLNNLIDSIKIIYKL